MELLYDPVLNCYYDHKTHTYYELKNWVSMLMWRYTLIISIINLMNNDEDINNCKADLLTLDCNSIHPCPYIFPWK